MVQEQLLDTRHMRMPEPLLAALSALDALAPGMCLRLLTEREPLLLYPLLETRGFRYTRLGAGPDGWQVLIRRTREAGTGRRDEGAGEA